jgi:hypothetical protein
MKLFRTVSSSLLAVGVLVFQAACGSDSSGPGSNGATTIDPNSSTNVTAAPGGVVSELPSVILHDQSGAPVVGAGVHFTVTAGGGSVTGANATTNASGIATVGSWTLGTAAGPNTLTATTGNLPAVTFTANGADPCANPAPHTVGATVNGALSASDCHLQDNSFADFYSVNISTGGTYVFSQSSATFDTYLAVLQPSGTLIGVNDDFGGVGVTNSRVKVILPPGTYLIAANSFDPATFGNYSLISATTTTPVTNCEDVFVLPAISSPESLTTTDCSNAGLLSDEYVILLNAGQSITVSMTSSVLDSSIEIRADGSTALLASNDNIDGTTQNARVSFTAPSFGFYIIAAASKVAAATGAYTFAIQ